MEKLTQPVTVKLCPESVHAAKLIGESLGMELSEYIRHLITADLDRARGQYAMLHQVFGNPEFVSKDTETDTVGHKTKTPISAN